MPFDPVAVSVSPVKHIECVREFNVKIRYGMTSAADKMIMAACIGIEVINAIPEPEPGNLSQIGKQRDVYKRQLLNITFCCAGSVGAKHFLQRVRELIGARGGLKAALDAFEAVSYTHLEDGVGTVEIVLLILVAVGLVLIFKDRITELVTSIFGKITSQAGKI